jgi:hypothetical protein
MRFAALLVFLLATPQPIPVGGQVTIPLNEVRAGYVTNNVHPGDPVQEVSVAGFATLQEALQFSEAGFVADAHKPVFLTTLPRGSSVGFAGASYLAFYHLDHDTRPTLLSITRGHADLHLVIGSCGYQFLLSVNTAAAAPQEQPQR